MKKDDISEVDIQLKGLPVNLTILIRSLLDENNYSEKHNARITLVSMGKNIIPRMHKLMTSRNRLLRMEATKIVELIANKRSIPKLVSMLDEEDFDIRWVAGEGLIKIGRESIIPVLKSIRDGKSSLSHNKAAHHILVSLLKESEKEILIPLLQSLDDFHELGEIAPTESSKALKTIFKFKS